MQDIELMHMRYALESTIFALGAVERTVSDERTSRQEVALCHLKDLRNHLEAIASIPRKVICGLHFLFVLLFAEALVIFIDCNTTMSVYEHHNHAMMTFPPQKWSKVSASCLHRILSMDELFYKFYSLS